MPCPTRSPGPPVRPPRASCGAPTRGPCRRRIRTFGPRVARLAVAGAVRATLAPARAADGDSFGGRLDSGAATPGTCSSASRNGSAPGRPCAIGARSSGAPAPAISPKRSEDRAGGNGMTPARSGSQTSPLSRLFSKLSGWGGIGTLGPGHPGTTVFKISARWSRGLWALAARVPPIAHEPARRPRAQFGSAATPTEDGRMLRRCGVRRTRAPAPLGHGPSARAFKKRPAIGAATSPPARPPSTRTANARSPR